MKINNLTSEEVFRSLVTSGQGLSDEEAARRLREFGRNEIVGVRKKHLPVRLLGQFTHFLATLLWLAAFLSFLSDYLHPGEGMFALGLAIAAVIVINAIFTFAQEYRAEKALAALQKLLPFFVKVIREGKEREIHAQEVVPGDVLLFTEGDKIPADARLIETAGLKVNHASLTGESEPLLRNHDPFPGELFESSNIVFAGTTVISGSGRAIVFATGMKTEFGRIALQDPPRPEVPEAISKCHDAGIRIIMITGDGSRTALAIARQIGLVEKTPLIIEGADFNRLTDHELTEKLAAPEIIFARMTPKHKMRVVSILKDKGEVVAVTGDGVNDAPALRKADIGISMGIIGTDVAKEASDMVLLDDNFATIVNAVEEGRTVYENIKKFMTCIFASNIPEAVPYLAYILFRIPLPLTIMQILAVDLGTDMLPALVLGSEKPTPGIMKQPPRRKNERLLSFPLIARAYLFLGPLEAVACMFGFFWVLNAGGWAWGSMLPPSNLLYMQATTACLTAIIVAQIANVFACRSSRESLLAIGFFTNKLIFAGIAVELLLQLFIVYHPLGNRIFSTAPLSVNTWLMLVPFAVFLLLAEETRKMLLRKAGK